MQPLKKLRASMCSSIAEKKTLLDIGLSGVTKEVISMGGESVTSEIESIILQAAMTIMGSNGFSYSMPSRTSSNMAWVPFRQRDVPTVFSACPLLPSTGTSPNWTA